MPICAPDRSFACNTMMLGNPSAAGQRRIDHETTVLIRRRSPPEVSGTKITCATIGRILVLKFISAKWSAEIAARC